MTPRDFVKFALAVFQASAVNDLQKSGVKELPKEVASSVNMANVKFVAKHEARIRQIVEELQAINPRQQG
jgi:hypothetical protein